MSKIKRTRPVAGTTGRATESDFAAYILNFNYTTDAGKRQEREFTRISDLLHPGRENGLTLRDLVRLTGLDEREVRRKIHAERKDCRDTNLIVSDNHSGYFLPERPDELKRFANSMAHRASEILKVARAAENALARMEGQDQMTGW